MCLSIVYLRSGKEQKEIMRDVARIEAEPQGLRLIDLFGKRMLVEGAIKTVDLVDGHFVVIEES
jgi:predicted RNA-binding protein